jgi:hypothetical protein
VFVELDYTARLRRQWLSRTQAASYCDTAAVLFACSVDAVPGFPA